MSAQFSHGLDVVKLCEIFSLSVVEENFPVAEEQEDDGMLTVDEFLRRCEVKILKAQAKKKISIPLDISVKV